MYNAANRSDVRKAEKAARAETANRGAILMMLASSVEGRQYLWDALEHSHIFASTFTGDPLRSAFLEGERNVGLRLLSDLVQECPNHFLQMMREANERRTSSNHDRAVGQQSGDEGTVGRDQESGDDFYGDAEGNFDGYDA